MISDLLGGDVILREALSCQPGDILRFEPDAEGGPASQKEPTTAP